MARGRSLSRIDSEMIVDLEQADWIGDIDLGPIFVIGIANANQKDMLDRDNQAVESARTMISTESDQLGDGHLSLGRFIDENGKTDENSIEPVHRLDWRRARFVIRSMKALGEHR